MSRRLAALAAALFCGSLLAAAAMAETPATYTLGETSRGTHFADRDYFFDIPLERSIGGVARGAIDTLCWGNTVDRGDGQPIAVRGTLGDPVGSQPRWDFEGGPFGDLQGWTSTDLTDIVHQIGVIPVRRVTAATFSDPRDTDCTITANGSTASVWFGALDSETHAGCWPGGQGYSNSWGLNMSKSLVYGGSGDVTIDIDYFTDSEEEFDYSYVYVINADGIRSPVLNASIHGRPDGMGWSGSEQEGSAIGSTSAPAHESMIVDGALLTAIAGNDFEILINFDSDPLYSDGLDSFGGFLNTTGPLGVDNVHVTGDGLSDMSDFEAPGAGGTDLGDGWTAFTDPPIGAHLKVVALDDPDLDPVGDPCGCPLAGNVMVASIIDGSDYPHPQKQNESIVSPPAYVGLDTDLALRAVRFDAWLDLPSSNGVGFRVGMHYYPWTCPTTLVAGWTIEPLVPLGGFFFQNTPQCGVVTTDNTGGLPEAIDSLKVVFDLLGDCDDFGTANCTGPEQTGQSPYWDNVQLCLSDLSVDAPWAYLDWGYQDVYPQANTLLPNATADIHSAYDTNRADQDFTNANLGDSIIILTSDEPFTEAYLNFRVYPGPATDTAHPWFSEYGGDFIATALSGAQDHWAQARMDTAELGGGTQLILGTYSTYDWPNGQETFSKIIEDGVLTPGSTVEYFFSTNFTPTPTQQILAPDTSGQTYLEFEVLPGYFEKDGDILAPCLLYVDAFNAGAQELIEDQALVNLLGVNTDDAGLEHRNWDRYDYVGSACCATAPMARESSGDNGMTHYQSMIYQTIMYNTGSYAYEGLRDGDAALLMNFLGSDDVARQAVQKGLWLSGDGMGTILSRAGRWQSVLLRSEFAGASLVCGAYRESGCTQAADGDSSLCVRLDADPDADFPQSAAYALRGNGCPNFRSFDVLTEAGGNGNLSYVDQDGGGTITPFASISHDAFAPENPANYGVVLDGFSAHHLRAVPSGDTSDDCGNDPAGILTRAADVLGFLNAGMGGCDPDPLITGVDADPSSVPIGITRLFRNAPNPFNPETRVRYELHDEALVTLEIFDVAGRLVRTLVDEVQEPGRYVISWDGTSEIGRDVSSGVYWVRMSTSLGFSAATRMVVLK